MVTTNVGIPVIQIMLLVTCFIASWERILRHLAMILRYVAHQFSDAIRSWVLVREHPNI